MFRPSEEMYESLLSFAMSKGSFDGKKINACGNTVKPVLSNHIKQDINLAFQTCGCLLLNESSAESSFLRYFHSAISKHLSIEISMSSEWVVA